MRSVNAAVTAAQKEARLLPSYKVALTYSGTHPDSVADKTFADAEILFIDHLEEPDSQTADIVLDNHDRSITANYEGFEAVISYGINTTYSGGAASPLKVMAQELTSNEGVLVGTLRLEGISNQLASDRASQVYELAVGDTQTIKTLLTAIVNAKLPPFSHCKSYTATYDSESELFDAFTPADRFWVDLNEDRLTVIKRLLGNFTTVLMRPEADGAVHFRRPDVTGKTWVKERVYALQDYVQPATPNNNFTYKCTTAGISGSSEPTFDTTEGGTTSDGTVTWTTVGFDYEYKLAVSGEHDIFNKATRQRILVPNFIVCRTHPDQDRPHYEGFAKDGVSSELTDMEKRQFIEIRGTSLDSNQKMEIAAAAMIESLENQAQKGSVETPLNVGAEIYDYIKLTDSRQDDLRIGNVRAIRRQAAGGEWRQQIAFGTLGLQGFLGMFLSQNVRNALSGAVPLPDVLAQLDPGELQQQLLPDAPPIAAGPPPSPIVTTGVFDDEALRISGERRARNSQSSIRAANFMQGPVGRPDFRRGIE